MLVVTSGRDKAPEEVVNITQTTLDTLAEKGVDSLACVGQPRARGHDRREMVGHIERKGSREPMPVYVIPEDDTLGKPSINDVRRWLGADVLYGHSGLQSLVDNYLVAAMQIGNFLSYIEKGSLIITPGDRSDIILSSLASRLSSSYPDIAGIVLTGGP